MIVAFSSTGLGGICNSSKCKDVIRLSRLIEAFNGNGSGIIKITEQSWAYMVFGDCTPSCYDVV